MNRTRFVFSSDRGFRHCSVIFTLCFLFFFNAGCSKNDSQEYEEFSSLSLARLDSAIAHFEARVKGGSHEQGMLDSLGAAYLHRIRVDYEGNPSWGTEHYILRDVGSSSVRHFQYLNRAEEILQQAAAMDPKDLHACALLVETLIMKLGEWEYTVRDSGFYTSSEDRIRLNKAYELAQHALRFSNDSASLWKPFFLVYKSTSYRSTYHDSARAFFSLKLGEDKRDPMVWYYAKDYGWGVSQEEKGFVAREHLRLNLTHPYIWEVIKRSKEFNTTPGSMMLWLDKLRFIPNAVKFSYGLGFRFIKTTYSREDRSLITTKIQKASSDFPDNEYIHEMLIRDHLDNGRFDQALDEFSALLRKNNQTVFLSSYYGIRYDRTWFREESLPRGDSVGWNRFFAAFVEKSPNHPLVYYTKADTNFFNIISRGSITNAPIMNFSITHQLLDSCLQKDQNFLPAYCLLFKIMCSSQAGSSDSLLFKRWKGPEEVLWKMVGLTEQRKDLRVSGAFFALMSFYERQGKFDLIVSATRRFKGAYGISDIERISQTVQCLAINNRTDLAIKLLQENQNTNRATLAFNWRSLGYTFIESGKKDFTSADKYFQKAFELMPPDEWVLDDLEWMHAEARQYHKIIDLHKRFHFDGWPYLNQCTPLLAWSYYKVGQKAEADSLLAEFLKIYTYGSSEAFVVKAAIAQDRGDANQVSEFLKRAKSDSNAEYVDDHFRRLTNGHK